MTQQFIRKSLPVRVKNKLRNELGYKTARFRKNKLNTKDFTIIANNCWGGRVSKMFGLRYNSPTIGVSMLSDDYITFLNNLDGFLESELYFVDFEQMKWKDYYTETNRNLDYPTGQLVYNGHLIELAFVNYHTKEEALEKWNRRRKRVNKDKLLIKMSEQNAFSEKNVAEFEKLKFKNKLLFVNSDYSGKDVYRTADYEGDIDIEDEPIFKIADRKIEDILNNL